MNPSLVEQTLISIQNAYGTGTSGILDDSANWVLPQAIDLAKRMWARTEKDPRNHSEWGYDIYETDPLRFRPEDALKGVTVDVYCRLRWSRGTDVPSEQVIQVRVWSRNKNLVYRPDLDSERVHELLKDSTRKHPGRVISRFHLDRANLSPCSTNEYHPEFHLQVGGDSEDYELCWHPDTFDLPRIPLYPMELFLTCQLVAINFFPDAYDKIKKERHWKGRLRDLQQRVWLEHHKECVRTIDAGDSLLDLLRA